MKPSRYYEIQGHHALVYDHPYTRRALSMSVVPVADLAYYRANFTLSKVWGETPGGEYPAQGQGSSLPVTH